MTREELQDQALDLLVNHNDVLLQWGTGVGKGYFGVKALSTLKPQNTLILVAERAHIDNWKEEFKKQGQQQLLDNCTIACYASLKKYLETEWDLLILDESHHACSDLRLDYLFTIKANRVLALSATMKKDDIQNLSAALTRSVNSFYVSKVGLQDAIEDDILPEPKIYLIPLTLNKTEFTEIIEESWGKKEKRVNINCKYPEAWGYRKNKVKYPNVNLTIYCTQYQKYSYICEQFNYWQRFYMRNRNEAIKNKWLQWGSKRKLYLGQLKTTLASTLVSKLQAEGKRFICFCANIEQATALGGENAVHSKATEIDAKIKAFNEGKQDSLFCCQMLTEGQNLNNIEAGVLVQLDGNERTYIQKAGRAMRAKNPEIYIFYYKDTRDEEFLKNAIQGIDKKYIENYEIHS